VYARGGFSDLLCRLLFSPSNELKPGEEVTMDGLTVQVVAADERGLAVEAVFTFDRSLDDESLLWLVWDEDAFRRFQPPAVGETVDIPPMELAFLTWMAEGAGTQNSELSGRRGRDFTRAWAIRHSLFQSGLSKTVASGSEREGAVPPAPRSAWKPTLPESG
jgi:hypothetical protein